MRKLVKLAVRVLRPVLGSLLAALALGLMLGGCSSNATSGIAGHYVAEEFPEIYLVLNEDHTFRLGGPSLTIGGKEAIGEWGYENGEVLLYEYFRHLTGELTLSDNPITRLTKQRGELRGRALPHTREFTWTKQ
jgi:hypothetical protein